MTENVASKRRRRWAAAILALAGPGLGHLYGGRVCWAIAWVGITLLAFGTLIPLMVHWDAKPFNTIIPFGGLFLWLLVQIGHAWWVASCQPKEFELRSYNRWYYYIIWLVAVTFLFSFIKPMYGRYKAFSVPSSAMESTIKEGDFLMADMAAYNGDQPVRGDIIVFLWPVDGETKYIKRCIGMPGDTVEIIDKKLFVNGNSVIEPSTILYFDVGEDGEPVIHPRRSGGLDSRDNWGPFVIAAGNYFVLGDNRDNSSDSRFWGTVPEGNILGKAMRIHYSRDWSRVGLRIK